MSISRGFAPLLPLPSFLQDACTFFKQIFVKLEKPNALRIRTVKNTCCIGTKDVLLLQALKLLNRFRPAPTLCETQRDQKHVEEDQNQRAIYGLCLKIQRMGRRTEVNTCFGCCVGSWSNDVASDNSEKCS